MIIMRGLFSTAAIVDYLSRLSPLYPANTSSLDLRLRGRGDRAVCIQARDAHGRLSCPVQPVRGLISTNKAG